MKNNGDRSCKKKKTKYLDTYGEGGGGGEWEATEMDAINQLKIHFDSLVKVISKKKKAAKIKRLINNEQHVTPSL